MQRCCAAATVFGTLTFLLACRLGNGVCFQRTLSGARGPQQLGEGQFRGDYIAAHPHLWPRLWQRQLLRLGTPSPADVMACWLLIAAPRGLLAADGRALPFSHLSMHAGIRCCSRPTRPSSSKVPTALATIALMLASGALSCCRFEILWYCPIPSYRRFDDVDAQLECG